MEVEDGGGSATRLRGAGIGATGAVFFSLGWAAGFGGGAGRAAGGAGILLRCSGAGKSKMTPHWPQRIFLRV